MIFYFSGTGNSEWVAQTLASKIGDKAADICAQNGVPSLDGEECVGLVFPVYAWGVPQPMLRFAQILPETSAFRFGICTCGSEAGLTMRKLSAVFRTDSSYSIDMPNNYVIGSDVESCDVVKGKLEQAARDISVIAEEIGQKKRVYRVKEGSFGALKSNIINKAFNKFARSTKPFSVDKNCIGCGLCQRGCPAGTIRLVNGSPTWGKECYQCLRCINLCPVSAIQYGKKTRGRGRYDIKKFQ